MNATTVISVRGRDRATLLADPTFVYVGRTCWGWRGSVFANPYTVKMWQASALTYFAKDLAAAMAGDRVPERTEPEGYGTVQFDGLFKLMVPRLPELRGKVLGCWCGAWRPGDPPIACHAVELAQIVNGLPDVVGKGAAAHA